MSTDPKPPKPMPSADEINAYLELSAARTKLRLPLAKGNAAPLAAEPSTQGAPAMSASKKLPTRQEQASRTASERPGQGAADGGEVWRPFPSSGKR
jgi:hypothetical protein